MKPLALCLTLALALTAVASAQTTGELLAQARTDRDAGRLAEAAAIYRGLLEDPAAADQARLGLALVLSWQGRLDEAAEQYREVRRRYPEHVREATLGLARTLAWDGRLDAAVAELDLLLARDPADVDALLLKARTLAWLGRSDAALATYDQVLAVEPGSWEARVGIARTISWTGRLDEATDRYRELLEERPDGLEARVGLARTLTWRGRPAEALEVLAAVPPALQSDRDVRLARVAAHRALGERGEARRILGDLGSEFPDYDEVRRLRWPLTREVGPYVAVGAGGFDDSDDITGRSAWLRAAVPLGPPVSLFAEARREQLEQPGFADTDIDTALLGLDAALGRGFSARLWGGEVDADGAEGGAIGGLRLGKVLPRGTSFALGATTEFAYFTPQAVGHDVRIDTYDASLAGAVASRGRYLLSYARSQFEADAFEQERDAFFASTEYLIVPGRVRVDLGARYRHFEFDRTIADNGYFDPERFRRALGTLSFTLVSRGEPRAILGLGYGVQAVNDDDWEDAKEGSLVWLTPLGGFDSRLDLSGRVAYSELSLTTGSYSDWSASLELLVRLD